MRYLPVLFIFCWGLWSCKAPKTECKNYNSFQLFFERTNNDSIPDTAVLYTSYRKGSNFSSVARTYEAHNWRNTMLGDHNAKMVYLASEDSGHYFDWRFVCYPSGKTFDLKGIRSTDRSEQQVKYHDHDCANDLMLLLNDSLYQVPGTSRSYSAFIELKYD